MDKYLIDPAGLFSNISDLKDMRDGFSYLTENQRAAVERFLGIITEHFGGAFPVWLAPVQVRVMNITDRSAEYAEDVVAKLKAQGVRAEVDLRNEKIGYKIREAQGQKIPYMLVVGDKEVENGTVSVRTRSGGDKGSISLDEFAETITKQIRDRELETV